MSPHPPVHSANNTIAVAIAGTTTLPSPARIVALKRHLAIALGVFSVCILSSCAGNSSGVQTGPPTVGDFSLLISAAQVDATQGNASALLSTSVTPLNGFADSVTVKFSGLPSGVSTQPSGPFTLTPGAKQSFSFSIANSSPIGIFSVQVQADSGSIRHSGQVALAINPAITPLVTNFDDGTSFVLETQTATETVRIGMLQAWGAAITEVSLNGVDYVNNDDPGRQIQTSLWDENANYLTSWGYNPIEAGDHFYQGSPVLASALLPDGSIYTKTQPIQWAPENFGGGPGSPVLGDAYIEKWVSAVPGFNRVFKVHYKITHFGSDTHANKFQELPVMYVNPNVPNFFYYGGIQPWTNGALSQHVMPANCCDVIGTPEDWGAYVDGSKVGIALYTPQQFPVSKGFNASSTLQFTPLCTYTWNPGTVLDFDTFILVGPIDESRAAIYALHNQESAASSLTPMGWYDSATNSFVASGTISVSGWSWPLPGMASVDVFVDGKQIGAATYGLSRPDIPISFPGAPSNTGFQYSFDTTAFPNGPHALFVKATDKNGNIATYATQQIMINN